MIDRYECTGYGSYPIRLDPAGDFVYYDEYYAEVARLTSIISGLQSTLEYVRAQTLQALDIDWAGPEEEPAEAVSKQYLDGLEDIKTALSDV